MLSETMSKKRKKKTEELHKEKKWNQLATKVEAVRSLKKQRE
jgi:hypothetical protein